MKTIQKGPFLGINNRKPDYALQVKDAGDFLRDAVNVDLDNAGTLRSRKAIARLQALSSPHSLHMLDANNGYVVISGAIYSITLPNYTQTFFKTLSTNDAVSWLEWNGDLYYSNGIDSGRIRSGSYLPIALPTPAAPSPTPLGTGDLLAGWYQVAQAYYNNVTGEESGISSSCNYHLTSPGGLRVSMLSATPGATHVNIYCSLVNGSIPKLYASIAIGSQVNCDITGDSLGRESNQRYEAPLPAGYLFLFNGCLCSYSGSNVYEGLPFRPGYYLPTEGRIPFPDTVTNCVPAQNGVYVSADKTYWLQGSRMTAAETIQDVLPYGAVPHTEFSVPNRSLYGWFSKEGVVFGTPSGEVQAVMSDNVKLTPPATGVSTVLESEDYRRVVSCGWCLNLDTKGASRYTEYDFTSISRGYGTKPDGIYQLETVGSVTWSIDLGKENFGTEEKKRMPAIYVGAASTSPVQCRVQTPTNDYTYTAKSSSTTLKEHRIDSGKGLQSGWFNLSLQGESDLTLASVSFAPVASTRRI